MQTPQALPAQPDHSAPDPDAVRWFPFAETYRRSYFDCARRLFGDHSYQASSRYLAWLYEENPDGFGYGDLFLAVKGESTVVGFLHRMRSSWKVDECEEPITALHNLMVDQEYRSGIGFLMTMGAIRASKYSIIPGVSEPLASVYDRMKSVRLLVKHYRCSERPVSLAVSVAKTWMRRGAMSSGRDLPRPDFSSIADFADKIGSSVELILHPGEGSIAEFAGQLNTAAGPTGPIFTPENLRWRCFHPIGPRHFLFRLRQDGRNAYAAFSVGVRRDVLVSRLIAHSAMAPNELGILVTEGRRFLKSLGAQATIIASGDPIVLAAAKAHKWRETHDPPKTYLCTRPGVPPVSALYPFQPIAGDYGFEALLTDR